MDPVEHELVNAHGDRVCLLAFGARIRAVQLMIGGESRDVVLGYPSPGDYLADTYYMGAIAGRYCNRIGGSRFSIDGTEYRLPGNDGGNHLHGGPRGFSSRSWRRCPHGDTQSVDFELVSEDGDQGYPGALTVVVSYRWNDDRELLIRYHATTDRPTHVNLASHAYFNLDSGKGDILGHDIRIAASGVTEVDSHLIPTGATLEVTGTDLDLRRRTRIRGIVESTLPIIGDAGGLDLNYVLDGEQPVAELWSSSGDLRMTVETSYPGLQLYTGHELGPPWRPCSGLCLEAQYFPDSPNQPGFPVTLLVPGREYDQYVRYRFIEE